MLTQKYRPRQLIDMLPAADLSTIQSLIDTNAVPNVLLFHGKPGLGKTTLARWLGLNLLNVTDKDTQEEVTLTGESNNAPNYTEIDFSRKENNNKDSVDKYASMIKMAGETDIVGDTHPHVFVLDEFDKVSGGVNTKMVHAAQKQIVKVIEDLRTNNVYIIIAVNNIDIIEESVMSRAIRFSFTYPSKKQCITFLQGLARKEKKTITPIIAEDIYNSVNPPSLRGLVLNLGVYLKTNRVNESIERTDGLVSGYVGCLNNLAKHRISKERNPKDEEILMKEMRNSINSLINAKSTMISIIHALASYYEYKINANNALGNSYASIELVSNIFQYINTYINESFSYTNPFLDMIMLSHQIIEYKVQLHSSNKKS